MEFKNRLLKVGMKINCHLLLYHFSFQGWFSQTELKCRDVLTALSSNVMETEEQLTNQKILPLLRKCLCLQTWLSRSC